MKCPYCSQEIPDDSVFCEHCGGAVLDPKHTIPVEAMEGQAQAATHPSRASRTLAGGQMVTTRTPWGKLPLGVVVGAVTAALPGVLLLLAAVFFEMTTTAQGSRTGVGLLALCGGAMVLIGAAVGAVFGGVLGAAGAAIGQKVKGERGATVGAIVGGVICGAMAAVGLNLVGSAGPG